MKYQKTFDYLCSNSREKFETFYDLDSFIGYEKFKDHSELIPSESIFNFFLFDNKGPVENMVNMASLLRNKYYFSTINFICVDDHLHTNKEINTRIINNLENKNVQVYLNSDVEFDTEKSLFSVFDKESGEAVLQNQDTEFLFYSSFRKWPTFLSRSGIFEEEFNREQLFHNNFPNIFILGSMLKSHNSLSEKFTQSTSVVENIQRQVIILTNLSNSRPFQA